LQIKHFDTLVIGAGIIDYGALCKKLEELLAEQGVFVFKGCEVKKITKSPCRIIPFRGEYHKITGFSQELCRFLIYPLPNPKFPFLGLHLTRTLSGELLCGPNAVLAYAREGYDYATINVRDLYEIFTHAPFLKFAGKHLKEGFSEFWRSVNFEALMQDLHRLIPEVREEDVSFARSGVRAQALTESGQLADDFMIDVSDNVINVLNAPSPAATSAFAIAESIVDLI
jgi:L-2-hydroxyglutarate oxidase